jgi:hypothetical protein
LFGRLPETKKDNYIDIRQTLPPRARREAEPSTGHCIAEPSAVPVQLVIYESTNDQIAALLALSSRGCWSPGYRLSSRVPSRRLSLRRVVLPGLVLGREAALADTPIHSSCSRRPKRQKRTSASLGWSNFSERRGHKRVWQGFDMDDEILFEVRVVGFRVCCHVRTE